MPIKINGSTSGYTEIKAPDTAPNNTLTLPSTSGTLMTTGGTNTFTANQVIEVTDNTNAALRITQLGTGDAIRVEDETNPDSTPFIVDASGNVGIGTTSIAAKLDVRKAADGSIARFMRIGGTNLPILNINGTESTSTIEFEATGASAGPITFKTGAAERMRIDSSGNVLVGGTTYAGAGVSISTPTASGSYSIIAAGGTGFHWRFGNVSNGVVGSISTSTTATTYATSSDYRLKEDVQPVSNAAQRVMSLHPVNFAWKADGSRVDGFIAHEAQEVVPEAVIGTKDAVDADGNPIYQGIDQSKLVPLLTAALQEALTKIDALEDRIAALENA